MQDIGADIVSGFSGYIERYVFGLQYLELDDCAEMGCDRVHSAAEGAIDAVKHGWFEKEKYPTLLSHDLLRSCFGVPDIENINDMVRNGREEVLENWLEEAENTRSPRSHVGCALTKPPSLLPCASLGRMGRRRARSIA